MQYMICPCDRVLVLLLNLNVCVLCVCACTQMAAHHAELLAKNNKEFAKKVASMQSKHEEAMLKQEANFAGIKTQMEEQSKQSQVQAHTPHRWLLRLQHASEPNVYACVCVFVCLCFQAQMVAMNQAHEKTMDGMRAQLSQMNTALANMPRGGGCEGSSGGCIIL
jgi:hypothetical protein